MTKGYFFAMFLLSFCHWLAKTHISIAMRHSTYGFAVVEIGHLLALAIFGGSVILVDLRLLGLGFKSQPAAEVAKDLLPLTAGGVLVMLCQASCFSSPGLPGTTTTPHFS